VTLALEDGDHPFVVEGQARSIDVTTSLAQKFKPSTTGHNVRRQYTQLIEVMVSPAPIGRVVRGGSLGLARFLD